MNRRQLRRDIAALVRGVRGDISPEYRAYEDDDAPGILLTVGADAKGWSYQTGDNSFTGGAYSFRQWGVTGVYRDSNSYAVANDIIGQLDEAGAFDKVQS